MSEHTPGPWSFEEDSDRYIRDAKGELLICDTSYYPVAPGNAADYPLIAAAPEMLSELRRLHAQYGHQATADIIARATGATVKPA